jgi:hypothetical protein
MFARPYASTLPAASENVSLAKALADALTLQPIRAVMVVRVFRAVERTDTDVTASPRPVPRPEPALPRDEPALPTAGPFCQ